MHKYLPAIATALWLGLAGAAAAQGLEVALPKSELEQLFTAYDLIKSKYVEPVDDKKLLTDAIGGMVAALDPHSQFMSKDDLAELAKSESGEYVGVGMEVEIDQGLIKVTALTEGGPAESAGIVTGDLVMSIDGAAVTELRTSEVMKRMRGIPGSIVKLGVAGQGTQPLRVVSLARAPIHNDTVKIRKLANGIAWIRISEFEGATLADLVAALTSVDAPGAPKGAILDLRNNPGGLVTAAVGVAAAFLPADTVLFSAHGRMQGTDSVVSANARYYQTAGRPDDLAHLPEWTRSVPLVVLVNGGSASSAELVAGALQDHQRARIIGSQTFGKGSIQMVLPLQQGTAVKLTVARYFTPNGREIQARGITPDVVIAPSASSLAAKGVAIRESDLANHLVPENDTGGEMVAGPKQRAATEDPKTFGASGDKALNAAIATLAPQPERGAQVAAALRRLATPFVRSD
ncbi:MAG: family peptidase [Massilia sp.]|jgi:carboxyl-terminal processing protease|nr:family peptidase [Massilia sp.]